MNFIRPVVRLGIWAATVVFATSGDADAQSGASVGGMLGSDARSMFRLFGSQGSSRGLDSISSSVTTLDGHAGYFAAGRLVPFVTGVVPVVGDQHRFLQSGQLGPYLDQTPVSTLQDRIARLRSMKESEGANAVPPPIPAPRAETPAPAARNTIADDRSSATEAVDSIAAIRRQREATLRESYRAAADHFATGAQAEANGKNALAIYHFRIAEKDGDDSIRKQAKERIGKLSARP
jgi:hypothetical protein